MTTPAASANTWRWSSRPLERSSGPRSPSTCWRNPGSLSRRCMCFSGLFSLQFPLSLFSLLCVFSLGGRRTSTYFITYTPAFTTKTSWRPTGCRTGPLPGQHRFIVLLPAFYSHHVVALIYTGLFTMCICRYIDTQHCKVMQDIVSSKLYTEQFDAIQECFRNIGFTEEVLSNSIKRLYLDAEKNDNLNKEWNTLMCFLFFFFRRSTLFTEFSRPFWTPAILNLPPSHPNTRLIRVKCLTQRP